MYPLDVFFCHIWFCLPLFIAPECDVVLLLCQFSKLCSYVSFSAVIVLTLTPRTFILSLVCYVSTIFCLRDYSICIFDINIVGSHLSLGLCTCVRCFSRLVHRGMWLHPCFLRFFECLRLMYVKPVLSVMLLSLIAYVLLEYGLTCWWWWCVGGVGVISGCML